MTTSVASGTDESRPERQRGKLFGVLAAVCAAIALVLLATDTVKPAAYVAVIATLAFSIAAFRLVRGL